MKRFGFALMALFAGVAVARPVIIEPVATLPAPPGDYFRYGGDVAIDGDYALITAFRDDPTLGSGEAVAALVYRRTAAGWVYDSKLYETEYDTSSSLYTPSLALRNGIAALNFGGIFRRTATGWVRENTTGIGAGPDIEYSNGRFAVGTGEGDWGANVLEPAAPPANWRATRVMGECRDGDTDNNGGPLDIDGDWLALNAADVCEGARGGTRLYRRNADGSWASRALPQDGLEGIFPGVQPALSGNELFIDASYARPGEGTYLYRAESADATGQWPFRARLQTADSFMSRSVEGALEKGGGFVFQHRFSPDLNAWVYHVFGADEEGRYNHMATLSTSDRRWVGGHLDISGRRVIVGSRGYTGTAYDNTVRIYELPDEGPFAGTVIMDSFGTNSPFQWGHDRGDWHLVTSGNTTVYRQQFLGGDARIYHGGSQRYDGAIQVDVRPLAFNGNDRWFGAITRYVDENNYYYVTVRSSGRIELRRLVNGAFTTLASAPLAVTLNRNYRLRLESVGANHRVYLDDRLVLSARDTTHALGTVGLMTSRASADFDNVVITPNNYMTIYSSAFPAGQPAGPWSNTGPGAWSVSSTGTYAQNSVAGDARALIGPQSGEDQVVSVRARAIAFASGDRWFGALVRYVDDRNYAYVSLRSSNRISLRQLTNGSIRTLAEAPLTVTPGTWYTLRVEALLYATRVYVNGEMVLEASHVGNELPRGRVGLVTYKAAAEFDDFLAYQP